MLSSFLSLSASPYSGTNGAIFPSNPVRARLVVEGFSNKELAEKLSITERTVKAHLTHIFGKIGMQSRSGLHKIIS
jgi:hypothetical protein